MPDPLRLVVIGVGIGVALVVMVIAGFYIGQALRSWWHGRADRRRLEAITRLRAEMDEERRRAHLNAIASEPQNPDRVPTIPLTLQRK